jgi:nucleotide-binding universal stress UspA family protein
MRNISPMGEVRTVVADDPAPGRRYTLVVAVSNPDTVAQLMRTAVDLADAHDGEIRVVSVIHKPVTSPFLLFSEERIKREFEGGQRDVLESAVAAAEDAPVPVRRRLVVGTDVSDALLSAVDDADALLLGWQDRPGPSDVVLGTTVDPVVRRAPCDVFVERVGTTADGLEAVLLPTDGGPHVDAATELAEAVARANDAPVTVVSYVAPGAGAAAREAARDHVETAAARLAGVATETAVREAADAADAIVAAAEDHDFVALGATRERRFRNRVVGSVARSVGRRATPPVVIAKRPSGASLRERVFGRWW